MAITVDTIDYATLAQLIEVGAVRGADVFGQPGGWGVVIKYGMTERALAAHRGTIRNFKKFETLVSYLKVLGVAEYRVNAANFDPVALKARSTRPDATARLIRAHEAAAYDKWFRAQVEEGIKEADDPNTVMVPHAVVKKRHGKAAQRVASQNRRGCSVMLVWTPRARKQRHEAIEFIARDNPAAALSQLDEIEKQTDTLLQHPQIGRAGRERDTRELVIYRIGAERIGVFACYIHRRFGPLEKQMEKKTKGNLLKSNYRRHTALLIKNTANSSIRHEPQRL